MIIFLMAFLLSILYPLFRRHKGVSGRYQVVSLVLLSANPTTHAVRPLPKLIVRALKEISATADTVVNMFVVARRPKSTESSNRIPKMIPVLSPVRNVLALDQYMTTVINTPSAMEESAVAQKLVSLTGLKRYPNLSAGRLE